MSLIAQAKADIEQITGNTDEFGVSISFTSPASDTATVVGLATKHHLTISPEGTPMNGKNAHISVSESKLVDAGYPVRNANGEVDLKRHRVTWKDSTGNVRNYVINQWFPDETVGLIVCILGDYKS
jgi:hypothetical protein